MPLLSQVIGDACVKNGLCPIGQPIPPNIGEYAVREANRLRAEWNIQSLMIYQQLIQAFSLTARPPAWDADQTWYTIGPIAADANVDFNTTRPTRILRANLLINGSAPTGPVRVPLDLYNADQWASVTTPTLGTYPYPTALYDDYADPISKLYLWPYPNQAGNQLEIFSWKQSADFADLADSFTMPPGYESAFMLTIAERLIVGLKDPDAKLSSDAAMARSVVKGLNSRSPLINTADSGTPNSTSNSQGNFYNGWVRP